jgi:CheY-like chemotaxis protein
MKLLIADDVKASLELERTFLRRADCQVLTARSGREVLALAEAERPELILLDSEMPEMNGLETIRALQADERLRGIPVVLLSAKAMAEEAAAAGAKDFVQRPVDEERFLKVVTRYSRARIRKDLRRGLETTAQVLCGDCSCEARVMNVSAGGLFLRADCALQVGDKLSLQFLLPAAGGPKKIQAEAAVVRATMEGFGLGFTDISEGAKLYLARYVSMGG